MELLRVKTLIHVDKWQPWLSPLLKTKLVRYVEGQREVYTEKLYVRPEGDPGGYFAAGFLDDVVDAAKSHGLEVKYADLREYPEHAYDTDPEALRVQLRFKQDEAIQAITEHDKGIIKCSTGFGKSFIIKCLTILYPNARFVITTEAASVVQSLYDQLVAVHGKANVGLIKGGTKSTEEQKRIQVSTTKSILRSQIRTCDILLFDEVHNCGNNIITELLMNNVDHARMFGFTASLWRGDKAEDLIKGLFGKVITEVSYQEAVEHNLVVPIKALMIPCNTKERQVTDSMMLDKKFNYFCNRGRNELIAEVAHEIPDDEQTLIMVSTLEHAVRLHEFLPEYTVCHGGNGVRVKRNKPWTPDNAPEVVTVVSKSKGTVDILRKAVNGLGITMYSVLQRTSDFMSLSKFSALSGIPAATLLEADKAYDVGGELYISQPVLGKDTKAFAKCIETDKTITLSKLYSDCLQMDGSPCGAPQMVDRHIGDADMSQYRLKPKDITKIRKDFEAGTLKKLIATNIFSEGVNFVHLKYLIRADGEVSKISNTQIPGRLSRLCEGKTCAYLFDFIDHFSPWAYQRSIVRFKDYKENGWLEGNMPPKQEPKEN